MTKNKHFTIEKSFIAEDTFCIRDNSGKFSFPITPDKSELIMYQKALNELKEENEDLKKLLEAYRKSVEDYKYQICKAVDEKLSMIELADNCGIDVE